MAAFEPLDSVRAIQNRVARHLEIVRHVAHLLDRSGPASQAKRVLRTYLNRLEEEAPRRGRAAATGHFVDHVVKVSNSYWPGLFHTYDHPQIPRTTNELEGFFGTSKQGVRRTTGRMSTAGGKLESCGEAILRTEALLHSLPATEVKERIEAVSPESYQQSKDRLHKMQEPARERRSIQRNVVDYLKRLLGRWFNSS